jgi:hypothetical protein
MKVWIGLVRCGPRQNLQCSDSRCIPQPP